MEAWDVLVECFQKLENCQAYVIDNRRLYDTVELQKIFDVMFNKLYVKGN